ncbi:MAG: SprT family zinc-dependent metalloprotease [Planctomycetota bacterium]
MIRTYKDIQYTLTRSKRKTASIYIERDSQVTLLAPQQLTDAQVEGLLEEKRKWIYLHLAEWHDLNTTRVQRQYVNGEGFLYLGRSYRLRIVKNQAEPLMLKDGYFCLRSAESLASGGEAAYRAFYRTKGAVKIPERVAYFQAKMGVEPKALRVIDLKHHWASCTHGGKLNFHWKCMMAPATVLDYIVVHELAHIRYPNHTAAFWNEVDKVMPDYQERKEWLRGHGAGMDL